MLCDAALAAGHSVVRWTSTHGHYDKDRMIEGAITPYLEIRRLRGPGYTRSRSFARLRHHRAEALSFSNQACDLDRPDLIYCCLPTPHLCHVATDYGRSARIPVVIDVRDPWPLSYLSIIPPGFRRGFNFILVWEYLKIKKTFSSAKGIVAISETFLNWALNLTGRVRGPHDGVFYIGSMDSWCRNDEQLILVYREKYWKQLQLHPHEFVIIFAGSLVSAFDFATVFAALKKLLSLGIKIRLVIAGDGPMKKKLMRSTASMNEVVWLGWIQDRRELRALYSLAHAGIAPYKLGCTMSLPNKPFEYMAANLPLISSLQGEMAEIIDQNVIGINYIANDVNSLVEAVKLLVSDRMLRDRLARNSRQLFESHFDANRIYPSMIKHLEHIVCSKSHACNM
jgi:glycosyltransferase involved in cell wall biosynthesis